MNRPLDVAAVRCRRCTRMQGVAKNGGWPRGWVRTTPGGWTCPKCKWLPAGDGGMSWADVRKITAVRP